MKLKLVVMASIAVLLGLSAPTSAFPQQHQAASPPSRMITWGTGPRQPVDPSNPANEVDFVGQLHNEGLDYIASNMSRLGSDPALFELRAQQLASEFACANQAQISQLFSGVTPGTLPDDCSMSEGDVAFLGQLTALQNNTSLGFEGYINAVKQVESTIASDAMSTRAKVVRLSACSVARYSAAYWYAETQRTISPWGNPPTSSPAAFHIGWKKVAGADISGAITGGAAGAGGAVATGGTSVVVGAAVGAVAGSAVEIVKQWAANP